jgi:hypothetical protein
MDKVQVSKKSQIIVRLALAEEDIELTRPLSVELHAESRFSNIPYSHKKRDKLFKQALDKPEVFALMIAEYNGMPIGFLFCTAGEYIVGQDELLTTVYSFYVSKKYRGYIVGGKAAISLLNSVVKWSKNRKVTEIMIHVTTGININRIDKFLRHAGFVVTGGNYALSLNNK